VIGRSDGTLVGVGGLRLSYQGWEPPTPRAALLVVHGLGEHGGRYDGFARHMGSRGFSTFAFDLRGHGRSEGRRGHVPSFETYLLELDRFRREIEGLVYGRLPLFLLGHSLGGLIALRYLEEFRARFRAAVILSPWLATALPLGRLKAAAASLLAGVLPALPFPSGIRPEDLTRDPAAIETYDDDPLVHRRITPRLFVEASAAMGLALQRSDRISEPILFLLAGADRVVQTDRTITFARSMTGADIEMRVYPDAHHELLHELERLRAYREIADWLSARL
jgi:alpha-beta hydrolase superfamily lysophospholipase